VKVSTDRSREGSPTCWPCRLDILWCLPRALLVLLSSLLVIVLSWLLFYGGSVSPKTKTSRSSEWGLFTSSSHDLCGTHIPTRY